VIRSRPNFSQGGRMSDPISAMVVEAEQIRAAMIQAAAALEAARDQASAAVQAARIQADAARDAGWMTLSAGALAIVAAVIGARAARRAAKIGVHHLEQKQIKERIIYMYYLTTKLDQCQTEFLNEGEFLKHKDRVLERIKSEEITPSSKIEHMFPNSSKFVQLASPENWKELVEFYDIIEDMENTALSIGLYISLWRFLVSDFELYLQAHARALSSMRKLAAKLNEQICNERQSIAAEPALWKRFRNIREASVKLLSRARAWRQNKPPEDLPPPPSAGA
jgi:hypothetical protein